ncbi:MAG: hypothetical protein QOJ64_3440 [Acidobacteriota bacterium]|jgi:hypothetical protein|nr:hypothetical protein [Acidobacteriota bacterium]
MKNNGSTEIDQLMRRLGRRSGPTARSESQPSGQIEPAESAAHLDADEMNAFAEGALPDSSRARYFAHLADCDSCRKLVTDLALAAAPPEATTVPLTATATVSRKSWRDWLAAIFSPPVLRYAVPAVALFAIIIVALIATRTQKNETTVAQKEESGRSYAPSITANSNSTANTDMTQHVERNMTANSVAPNAQTTQAPTGTATAPPATKAPMAEEDSPVVRREVAATPAPTIDDLGKQGRQFGEIAQRAEQEVNTVAQQPKPAETAPPDIATRDKQADEKKPKVAGKDDDVTISDRAVGGAVATESRAGAAKTVAGRRIESLPISRPAAPPKNEPILSATEKERSSDQRNVGGRKFRRNAGAWVDTAYTASLQTTHVARGSEQFRALIADEPGLRAITRQLGGEVIVVWKSRAYRFY